MNDLNTDTGYRHMMWLHDGDESMSTDMVDALNAGWEIVRADPCAGGTLYIMRWPVAKNEQESDSGWLPSHYAKFSFNCEEKEFTMPWTPFLAALISYVRGGWVIVYDERLQGLTPEGMEPGANDAIRIKIRRRLPAPTTEETASRS